MLAPPPTLLALVIAFCGHLALMLATVESSARDVVDAALLHLLTSAVAICLLAASGYFALAFVLTLVIPMMDATLWQVLKNHPGRQGCFDELASLTATPRMAR